MSVAVAIFAHNTHISEDELLSLYRCADVLRNYPIYLVHPHGMDTNAYKKVSRKIILMPIDPLWLSSIRAYNRLKVTTYLYSLFESFEYLLTYELDAYVFRDELSYWCNEGWDYIGAPWFEGFEQASIDASVIPGGNSGFSLRKVRSARKVLQSYRPVIPYRLAYAQWRRECRLSFGSLCLLWKRLFRDNLFHGSFNTFGQNEDVFWSVLVPKRFPWFRVAPYEAASRFSFEMLPERLYSERGCVLPFGCHKWAGGNRAFWKRNGIPAND